MFAICHSAANVTLPSSSCRVTRRLWLYVYFVTRPDFPLPLPGLICLPLSLSSFHLFLSLSLTGGVDHVAVLGGLRSEVKGHMSPLVSTTNGETYWPACVCLHMLRQACSPRSDVPLWYSPIFICEFGSFLQIIINISYKNKSSVLCKCSLSSFRSLNSKNILK